MSSSTSWVIVSPGDSVECLDERDTRNMNCEAVRQEKPLDAVTVSAVAPGSAVGGRPGKVQGLNFRRRSSCDPGMGSSSMDLVSGRDETQFVDRTLVRTGVFQKQAECKVGSDMPAVRCRSCQYLSRQAGAERVGSNLSQI